MSLQCNSCGCVLETDVKNVVLPCLHIYCLACAQNQLESDSTCVQCGAMFSHKAVKGVNVLQDASKHALTLCGQTPEVIMQSALTAVNFYVKQTELLASLRENKLQRKMELLHQQCNEKLQQVHNAYTKAKGKAAALAAQLQEANADKEELHSKYQQRSSQVKQLKEQLQAVQRQQHQLTAPMPQQFGNGGGGGLMGPPGNVRQHGRSDSPSASPMQGPHMVTTVQRTQMFSNMGHDANLLVNSPNMPRQQIQMPGSGGGQRRKSAGLMQQGGMLGGSGGDMLNMGFDMRIPSGGGHGGGNAMRQSLQGQQHQMGGQLGGLNMGMGHQQMKGHSGGGMMHNSNTLNLMGSPTPF